MKTLTLFNAYNKAGRQLDYYTSIEWAHVNITNRCVHSDTERLITRRARQRIKLYKAIVDRLANTQEVK